MSFRRLIQVAILVLVSLPLAVPAQAKVSWAVANRADEKIEALVSRLEPYLEPLPGLAEAPGAVLYHQILIATDEGESRRCENLILTIQDPDGMPEELMQPRQSGTNEVVSMSAFARRGSEYRRLSKAEIVHVPGREGVGRSHFEIDWGELKEGDVIGWSLVTQQERPHRFVPMRLGQRIPIVLAALQVQSNGSLAYDLRTNAVPREGVKQKKEEVTNGRVMSIKASVNQLAAVESRPDETPWPRGYPYIALSLKEVRIDSENQFLIPGGWAATEGWNQNIMAIGGVAGRMAEDLEGVDSVLSDITAGAMSTEEMVDAVFSWVRDEFVLLEGPEFDSGGVRDLDLNHVGLSAITTGEATDAEKGRAARDWLLKDFALLEGPEFHFGGGVRDLKDVINSKEATAAEKALLMGTLLAKLEIPFAAAAVRTPVLGPVDRNWKSLAQFDELVIRTKESVGARYWSPQCSTCEPGETPESWQGADVLTYEFASIATAERYELDVRQKAWIELKQVGRHYQFSPGMSVAGLPFDLVQFQADFESQPWAFFEKLGE
jgi:hypothetical protein